MTISKQEFVTWLEDFSIAFPNISKWLATEAGENLAEVKAKWYDVFETRKVTLAEAKAGTRDLFMGTAPMPPMWPLIPSVISEIARKKRPPATYRGEELGPLRPTTFPAAALFGKIRKLIEDGMTARSAADKVIQEWESDAPPCTEKGPNCCYCQDTGWAMIFSARAMQEMLRSLPGVPPAKVLRTCAAACSCHRGVSRFDKNKVQRYDSHLHCSCPLGDVCEKTIDTLRVFMLAWREKQEARTHQGLFNAWNNGGGGNEYA